MTATVFCDKLRPFLPMVISPPVTSLQPKVSSLHDRSHLAPYKSYFPLYKSYFAPCKKLVKYCHELFVLMLELGWFWTYVSSDLLTNAVSKVTGGEMIMGWSDWIPLWPTTVQMKWLDTSVTYYCTDEVIGYLCDLLLYRPTATWNLFVLQNKEEKFCWWWCHLHICLPLDHRQ